MVLKDLTIIIPCLDEVAVLQGGLDSIAARLPGQRVLVIRMGGWPEAVLTAHDLDLQILSASRRCASAARNLGARTATTRYLWFLDSDCRLGGPTDRWAARLRAALASYPDLIILQRAEAGRHIAPAVPTRWNFSRYCIEWNLVWAREHFFRLGGLDERCSPGSATLAQAGEAFGIVFRHYERGGSTRFVPDLVVEHPSLDNAGLAPRRQFEYAYGSNYVALRQIRRRPSRLALFWFMRTLAGVANDLRHGWQARSARQAARLLTARLLAGWDALVRGVPRPRNWRMAR